MIDSMERMAAFVAARLDEREQIAHAATEGPWRVDNKRYPEAIYAADGYTTVVAGGRWGGEASVFNDSADAIHIAANDPRFVLADVEYGRWLLADHAERRSVQSLEGLRRYAARWAEHPDYEPEWRPS